MNDFISFNGSLIQRDKFTYNFFNRAFSYGDGLFETVKVINLTILFWEDHFNRLLTGLKILKMDLPDSFNHDDLKSEMLKLATKNNMEKGCRIKINLFRDSAGWYTPADNSFSYIMQAFETPALKYSINDKGLKIKIFKDLHKPVNILSGFKSSSSLIYVLAGIFARELILDEALLLNDNKNVCEAVTSNIFIYKKNRWITPPLSEGCVDGVMRKQLLGIMLSDSVPLEETVIKPDDLINADEFIVTNVSQGIRWVEQLDEKSYSNKRAFDLFELLARSVNKQIKSGL